MDDVQKFIFAMRLMTGEAEACVKAHSTVATYDELTALLKKEYKEEVCLKKVHK